MKKKILIFTILTIILMLFAYFILPPKILYLRFVLSTYKTSQDTIQREIPSIMNNPKIEVEAIAYRITSPRIIRTYRDENNIRNTIEKASNILNQADIEIKVIKVEEVNIDLNTYDKNEFLGKKLVEDIKKLPSYNANLLNLVFVKRDPFSNFIQAGGRADIESNIAYIIDRHRRSDFGVLAHEIGHLFGLKHHSGAPFVEEYNKYLMEGGLILTKEEADKIYKKASVR